METQKPLLKDEDNEEVDVHMYRSIIGSLMYLTSSRPDIKFAVCACARYQVNLKVSHLHAMKRIFRLISWQCKKQLVVVNSITEAEYVAASSCYEAVHKELGDNLVRAATTASSLEAEHDSARVESFEDEESLGEDASKQGRRIDAIDADDEITLVNYADNEMFDVDDLGGEEEFVAEQEVVSIAATTTITTEEITLAQALEALKNSKPKAKWIFFQEPGLMKKQLKGYKLNSMRKKDLQKRAKKDQEASIALIETWDDIQAKIDDDHQLAKILQAQEQEELSDAEKATMFQQLLEKRRKHFTAKRAEEKRNKPPTQAQKRKIMCTYLKKKEGYKLKDLKLKDQMLKSFDNEDLEDLCKLVKARYGSTRPMENMDYLVWSDMKLMFEPHVEDEVWKRQQGYKVLEWKLYNSCEVHSLRMQSMQIYMLVEKKYPLTPPTLSMMLEKKLQIDYESKMAYQLCKLIKK
uniref:Uncharacterized protein n=1 Tax=Tanacetum cinerariifolium TaxID=118510 RepID=A0A6L2MRF5_TANCI|nr:hypothetical protein [Tanacetum cinerariifolium]